MERRQLEYFVAIADRGGYNRAARELNVAQPSLSRAISNLERELGVTLFHRLGRNVVLSSAGSVLLEEARLILRGFGAMHATAQSIHGGVSGRVDVAVTSSSALEPVTSIVAELRDRHPGIVVSTSPAASAAEVTAMVRNGHCEVGICGHAEDPATADMVAYHLRDEEILLVLPPGEPQPGPRVAHDSLRGKAFVVSKTSTAMRALFDRLAAAVGDMTIAAEVGDRSAILPLVLRGVGAALMPDSWTDLARRSGANLSLLSPSEWVPQWLIHRQGPITPAARVFIDLTVNHHP